MSTSIQAAASAATQAASATAAAIAPKAAASDIFGSGRRASTILPVIALVGVVFTVLFASTGVLIVFVFAAILYFGDPMAVGAGNDIFDKAITAMTPLIGVIVGYLFGAKSSVTAGSGRGSGNRGSGTNRPRRLYVKHALGHQGATDTFALT